VRQDVGRKEKPVVTTYEGDLIAACD